MAGIVIENGVARRVSGWPQRARPLALGPRLVAGELRMPASHQLNKSPGEDINFRWSVTNNGDAPGAARLRLRIIGPGLADESSIVSISPGFTIPLFLTWSNTGATIHPPSILPIGASTLIISMADLTPGATTGLGDHVFSVNVS